MSARWTDETEELVDSLIGDCGCVGGGAVRVLEALADAGVLLPPPWVAVPTGEEP